MFEPVDLFSGNHMVALAEGIKREQVIDTHYFVFIECENKPLPLEATYSNLDDVCAEIEGSTDEIMLGFLYVLAITNEKPKIIDITEIFDEWVKEQELDLQHENNETWGDVL